MDADLVLILTTLGVDVDADAFARTLVEERLAACVNVGPPMTSWYRWKGGIDSATERQLVIKTTIARMTALEGRMRQLHPYELPEFLVVPTMGGSDAYLGWARTSVERQP